jgi:hypothetical protein
VSTHVMTHDNVIETRSMCGAVRPLTGQEVHGNKTCGTSSWLKGLAWRHATMPSAAHDQRAVFADR